MKQFLRKYRLVIGDGQNALEIDDLRVVFTATRSILSFPNQLNLKIYNLSRSTQTQLENQFTKVFLFVGYEGSVRQVFGGSIQNVSFSSNGIDTISTIFAGDSYEDFTTSTFSQTFSAKIALTEIVKRVAATFKGVTLGKLSGLTGKQIPTRSVTYDGHSAQQLDKLARTYGFSWKIENGVLSTVASTAVLPQEAILVSPETGLLEVPIITEIGVNVKTLLNPLYIPRGRITIDTTDAQINTPNATFYKLPRSKSKGTYPIVKVTHTGDNYGAAWTSTIETQFKL